MLLEMTANPPSFRAFFCLIGFGFTWLLAIWGPWIRALSMARFAAESEAGDRLFHNRVVGEETASAEIDPERVGEIK